MTRLALLLLGFMLTLLPVRAQEEIHLHPGEVGYGGFLNSSTSEIYAVLTAEAGQVVDIVLTSEEIDLLLTLIAPDGTILASDDNAWGNLNAYLRSPALPVSGDYQIKISSPETIHYGSFTLQTLLIDETFLADGDTINPDLQLTGLECRAYRFWGKPGEIIALHIDEPAESRASIILFTGEATCTENERTILGETLLIDDLDDGAAPELAHFMLTRDGIYNLMVSLPMGDSGEEPPLAITLERLEDHSLDSGTLTVRLNEQESSANLHIMLNPAFDGSTVRLSITQLSYVDAGGFDLTVSQNDVVLAHYVSQESPQMIINSMNVSFTFPVTDSGQTDVILNSSSTNSVTFKIDVSK